jgi:ABC-type transporter Mla subunit MlaD
MMPFPFMGSMMPMGPVSAMANMPLAVNLPTAEQMAEIRRAMLQNQQQQLSQLKEMVAQYAKSIDEALNQVHQELTKTAREGEETADASAAAIPVSQVQAQALAVRSDLRVDPLRVDPQRMDPQRMDPQRMDPQFANQALYQGGMGEFGRPVF